MRIQATAPGTIQPTLAQELVSAQDLLSGTNQASASTDNIITYNGTYTPDEFIVRVKTNNPGSSSSTQFTIPTSTSQHTYNYAVDCDNNGTLEHTSQAGNVTCTYGSPGEYDIAVTGQFPHWNGWNSGDYAKIIDVKQWGNITWQSMTGMFFQAGNLTNISAADAPDLSNVVSAIEMFRLANSFNGHIDHWDVSNITNMAVMFMEARAFNQPLNNWNVSNVTNMERMFSAASSFNQPLDDWDVSSVTDMSSMFGDYSFSGGAAAFNQPLSMWDVSNVTTMNNMFSSASSFNQPLNNWNVSNVTTMAGMFYYASTFNQPLNNWNVSNVTSMSSMFYGASSFNESLNTWDTGNVTDMSNMFSAAHAFNQPLGSWNVGSVTDMDGIFYGASAFNQPLNNWNVGNVVNMSMMFHWAVSFNQPLDDWDVSSVMYMNNMFSAAHAFNQPLGGWNVSNVTDMDDMLGSGSSSYRSGISSANYDVTLAAWSQQSLKSGVTFGASASYCAATARQHIIDTFSWVITDMGQGFCAVPEVTVTAGINYADVSWNEIPAAERYDVEFKLSSDSSWTRRSDLSDTSHYEGGLSPGSYDFRVRGSRWTGQGYTYGEWSNIVTVVIGVLPAPQNLVADPSVSSVELDWDDVESAWFYEIEYKQSSSSDWSPSPNNAYSGSYINIDDLLPETSYDFRVRTVDNSGNFRSDWSDIATATTLERQTYHVTNCKELQSIAINPDTFEPGDSTGNYVIDNDIDCSETSGWTWEGFAPPELLADGPIGFIGIMDMGGGGSFTGNLYGNGHKITNIYQNGKYLPYTGLLYHAYGSVIDDVHIEDISIVKVMPYNGSGGLVSNGEGLQITNSSVKGSISTLGNLMVNTQNGFMAGGIGGSLEDSTIDSSFVEVDIDILAADDSPVTLGGGLAGALIGGAISNSYALGSLSLDANSGDGGAIVGGLVGQAYGVTLTSSYAVMDISMENIASPMATAGGAVGLLAGSITDSFSVGTTPGIATGLLESGALAGAILVSDQNLTSVTNSYFDQVTSGLTSCVGSYLDQSMNATSPPTGNTCTAVNADGSQSNYFVNNRTNPPLNTWDFDDIWSTNASATPTFIGDGPLVPTVPGVVRDLDSSQQTTISVELTWQPPASSGNSIITDYIVEYKPTSASGWTQFNDGFSSATNVNVTGLSIGTSYDFRVAAVNAVGQGSFAEKVTITTLAAVGVPSVTTTIPYTTSVDVDWADITGAARYELAYKQSSASEWTSYKDSIVGSYVVLYGLDANTSYDIRVRAFDAAHNHSSWSDTETIATLNKQVYHVSDCRELQAIVVDPVTLEFGDASGHYILDNDIDCSDTTGWYWEDMFEGADIPEGVAVGFISITGSEADDDDRPTFSGSFDGGGYTISNIYQQPVWMAGGLFGAVRDSLIENVVIKDSQIGSIIRPMLAGGVAAEARNTVVRGVHVEGLVIGGEAAPEVDPSFGVYGGIIGTSGFSPDDVGPSIEPEEGSVVIRDSSASGSIISDAAVAAGGLVGGFPLGMPVITTVEISRSYADMDIFISSDSSDDSGVYIGGLVGSLPAVKIENSYAHGRIEATVNPGPDEINPVFTGGLVGWQYGGSIVNSYASADIVIHDSDLSIAGGIIGGAIDSSISEVEGFEDWDTFFTTTISNSFSSSSIDATSRQQGEVGGVLGTITSEPTVDMDLSSAYYDRANIETDDCIGSRWEFNDDADPYIDPTAPTSSCNLINTDDSNPGYFINNNTNAPLDVWDFANIWKTNADAPPTFRVATTDPVSPELPSAPRALSISNRTTTSMKLNWQPPASDGGSPITSYRVQYRKQGNTTWRNAPLQGPTPTAHTFVNLSPRTAYQFRVAAINLVGVGPYAAPIVGTTLGSVPQPEPPAQPETPLTPTSPTAPPSSPPVDPGTPTTDTDTNQPVPGTPTPVEPLVPVVVTDQEDDIIQPSQPSQHIPQAVMYVPFFFISLLLLVAVALGLRSWHEYRQLQSIKLLIASYTKVGNDTRAFLGIVAHYLNTPIAIMKNSLELLRQKGGVPADVTASLTEEVQRLASFAVGVQNETKQVLQSNDTATNHPQVQGLFAIAREKPVWIPLLGTAVMVGLIDTVLILTDAYTAAGLRVWNHVMLYVLLAVLLVVMAYFHKRTQLVHEAQRMVLGQQKALAAQQQALLGSAAVSLDEYHHTLKAKSNDITDQPDAKTYFNGLAMLGKLAQSLAFVTKHTLVGGPTTNTNLKATVQSVVDSYLPLSQQRNIILRIEIPDHLHIQAYPDELQYILQQVLDNAIKFSPDNSQVQVTAAAVHAMVRVTITDQGSGMSEAARDNIFAPFGRGSGIETYDTEGLGMGLHNAKYLIDRVGGTIAFKDNRPSGLVVELTLPATQPSPKVEA